MEALFRRAKPWGRALKTLHTSSHRLLCYAMVLCMLFTMACSAAEPAQTPEATPVAVSDPTPTPPARPTMPLPTLDASAFVAPTLEPPPLPSFDLIGDSYQPDEGPADDQNGEPQNGEPQNGEPQNGDQQSAEPQNSEPQSAEAAGPVKTAQPSQSPQPGASSEPTEVVTDVTSETPYASRPRVTPRPAGETSASAGAESGGSAGVSSGSYSVDASTASEGYIRVAAKSSSVVQIRLECGGKDSGYTRINADGNWQNFSLTLGSGSYKVSFYEQTSGNQYRPMGSETFSASISNANAAFLTSNPHVRFSDDMQAIRWAKENLTGTDAAKVEKAYNYIVNNIDYDYDIVGKLPNGYLPTIDNTFSSHKGICYDHSSLFAAMLRSVGVPTKLLIGNSSNVKGLHAWNEVYLDGKWRIVDTSNDACYRMAGAKMPAMFKSKGYSVRDAY